MAKAAAALIAALLLGGCEAEAGAGSEAQAPAAETAVLGAETAGTAAAAGASTGSRTRPASGERFTCTPTKLWDGDGPIHCAEGPRVRLSGIAAREMDGTCSPGHPCPDASAQAARDRLAELLGGATGVAAKGHVEVAGPALACRSAGGAGGTRTVAWCVSPSAGDLSCAMLASGTVARWDRYWQGHRCG
jgi:endonuclease YncB( thermonuclease family)